MSLINFYYYWSSSFMIALQFFLQLVNMLFKYHLYALRLTHLLCDCVCSAKSWTVLKVYTECIRNQCSIMLDIIYTSRKRVSLKVCNGFLFQLNQGANRAVTTKIISFSVCSDFGTCYFLKKTHQFSLKLKVQQAIVEYYC